MCGVCVRVCGYTILDLDGRECFQWLKPLFLVYYFLLLPLVILIIYFKGIGVAVLTLFFFFVFIDFLALNYTRKSEQYENLPFFIVNAEVD